MLPKVLSLPKGIHDCNVFDSCKVLNLIELFRRIGDKFGFEEVILSSINFSETADQVKASIGRRYDFLDKKGRALCLSVDPSLSILRALGAQVLEEGCISTLQRVFRYQNTHYRSWYQFCYGVYDNGESKHSDLSILFLIFDIIKNLNLKNIHIYLNDFRLFFCFFESYFKDIDHFKEFLLMYRFKFDPGAFMKQLSTFSNYDKDMFHHLTNNKLSILELSNLMDKLHIPKEEFSDIFNTLNQALVLIYDFNQLCRFDFSKFKSTDIYDGLMYQVWDPDKDLLLIEGGRYDRHASIVTNKMITKAVSVCIGVELLAREHTIPEKTVEKIYCFFCQNGPYVDSGFLHDCFSKILQSHIKLISDRVSRKIGGAKKKAINKGVNWFVVIGEDEVKKQRVTLEGMGALKNRKIEVDITSFNRPPAKV